MCERNMLRTVDSQLCLLLRLAGNGDGSGDGFGGGDGQGQLFLAYHLESQSDIQPSSVGLRAINSLALLALTEDAQCVLGPASGLIRDPKSDTSRGRGPDVEPIAAVLFASRNDALLCIDGAPGGHRYRMGASKSKRSRGEDGDQGGKQHRNRSKRGAFGEGVQGDGGQHVGATGGLCDGHRRRLSSGDGPALLHSDGCFDGVDARSGHGIVAGVVDEEGYRRLLADNAALTTERKRLDDVNRLLVTLSQPSGSRKLIRAPVQLARLYHTMPIVDGAVSSAASTAATYPHCWRELAATMRGLPRDDARLHCTHGVEYAGSHVHARVRFSACSYPNHVDSLVLHLLLAACI
jgi:hypothetical protein